MNTKYQERTREFYKRYYGQLKGATIVEFVGMNTDDTIHGEGFPCFKVLLNDGTYTMLEISQDEEGNGGGYIFGLNLPEMEDYDRKHGII